MSFRPPPPSINARGPNPPTSTPITPNRNPTVGQACDAHHITTPHPEGAGLAKALELALADAGLGKCVSFNVFAGYGVALCCWVVVRGRLNHARENHRIHLAGTS